MVSHHDERDRRRPRFASVTAFIRALAHGASQVDPIDALMTQAAVEQTAEYVRTQLLGRAMAGDSFAAMALGHSPAPASSLTQESVVEAALAQCAAYRARVA